MVEARTAVERRKASAPIARRAPHPKDAAPVNCAFRRSASLHLFGGSNILGVVRKTRMRMHRENEMACQ
jgi:hypothetical protein